MSERVFRVELNMQFRVDAEDGLEALQLVYGSLGGIAPDEVRFEHSTGKSWLVSDTRGLAEWERELLEKQAS